jgi:uncharacterized membrane protein YraQ (UPF0718 family)
MIFTKEALYASLIYFLKTALIISLMFFAITFIVAFFKMKVTGGKTRNILKKERHPALSYSLASFFGMITPFCSCSSIPVLAGMSKAGVKFGVLIAFIIASPLVNEVAVVMMSSSAGIKFTLSYVFSAYAISVSAAFLFSKLKMEKEVIGHEASGCQNSSCSTGNQAAAFLSGDYKIPFKTRLSLSFKTALESYKKFALVLTLGILIGSVIHNQTPSSWLKVLSQNNNYFWAIPVAALIGAPMYVSVIAVIPVIASLLDKGADIGVLTSFLIASSGTSIPSMVMLSKIFKKKLLWVFILTIILSATLIGYIMHFLFTN